MFQRLYRNIRNIYKRDKRSANLIRNIIGSFFNKGASIVISLLLIPLTIKYLSVDEYGIWLTLSSIVAWIAYFDVGLGHGFRNRFTEAKSKGDDVMARKYVTTTYVMLSIIFGLILLVTECLNQYLDWSTVLKVDLDNRILKNVVSILLLGSCVNFVLHVATIMLSADQKPAYSSFITTLGQAISLLAIFLLVKYTESNIFYLAICLSWIPCLVLLFISILLFKFKYKEYKPSWQNIDFSLLKNIVGLGGKFFIIQLSMLVIFQITNVLLSRILGPQSVTEYNIVYKYFSVTQMVYNIILSPFWSAFTEAYAKGDRDWMKKITKKLNQVWLLLSFINFCLLLVSPYIYKFWIGSELNISWSLSIFMCVYISILSFSNAKMVLLNGIGKVTVQMYVYIFCSLFSIPLCVFFCERYGIPGVLIVLSSVYLIQACLANHQLNLLLDNKANGVWNQ